MKLWETSFKAVYIDFDNTLCIWREGKQHDKYLKAMIEQDMGFYMDNNIYSPMPGMAEFIDMLKEEGIPAYGLSKVRFSPILPIKLAFVQYYYGTHIRDMIGVSDWEHKDQLYPELLPCKMHTTVGSFACR